MYILLGGFNILVQVWYLLLKPNESTVGYLLPLTSLGDGSLRIPATEVCHRKDETQQP